MYAIYIILFNLHLAVNNVILDFEISSKKFLTKIIVVRLYLFNIHIYYIKQNRMERRSLLRATIPICAISNANTTIHIITYILTVASFK